MAVATSAVREAENGGEFLHAVTRADRHSRARHLRHGRGPAHPPGRGLRRRRRRAKRRSSSTSAAAASKSRAGVGPNVELGPQLQARRHPPDRALRQERSARRRATSASSSGTSMQEAGELPRRASSQAGFDRVIGTSGTILSLGAVAIAPARAADERVACSQPARLGQAAAPGQETSWWTSASRSGCACRASSRAAPTSRWRAPCCSTRSSGAWAPTNHAVRSVAARRARPRLHRAAPQGDRPGRPLPRHPPPQRRRAGRALQLLARPRAPGGAAGRGHLRSDAGGARPDRSRARVARIRRAPARHRRAHQLRAPSQAFVLPDQERRPARLRARGDRRDRARRALPPPRDAEARGTRTTGGCRRNGAGRSGRWRPSCAWPRASIAATRRACPASSSTTAATMRCCRCGRAATPSSSCGPRRGTRRPSSGSSASRFASRSADTTYAEQPDQRRTSTRGSCSSSKGSTARARRRSSGCWPSG